MNVVVSLEFYRLFIYLFILFLVFVSMFPGGSSGGGGRVVVEKLEQMPGGPSTWRSVVRMSKGGRTMRVVDEITVAGENNPLLVRIVRTLRRG